MDLTFKQSFKHPVRLEELDGYRMARSRSESSISRNESSPQFFSEHDICSIIGGEIVTELPNTGQEHEMRISGKAEIQ